MTVAEKPQAIVVDYALVEAACEEASLEARKAAKAFYDKHGDRD